MDKQQTVDVSDIPYDRLTYRMSEQSPVWHKNGHRIDIAGCGEFICYRYPGSGVLYRSQTLAEAVQWCSEQPVVNR